MIVKNVEKKENNIVFQVESDPAEFESAVNAAYLKNKSNIAIPGFRKGKAPRTVVEGMYGVDVFYQDAMDDLAPKAFEQGINENEIKFVGAPSIVDVKVTDERGVSYTFSVEAYPEVTLGQYKGIEAVRQLFEVSEDDIANEIENARKQNARKVSVDREAQMGDIANIDFDGYLNGERFDGGKAEGYDLELGSHSFVPGFEEQIVGMKAGEEKDINITFPEQYVEGLAGKDVVFKVKLNSLSVSELPEVDDEFAQDNGFDTLDEYKADVKANIAKRFAEEAEAAVRSSIMRKAAENTTVTVPEVMINEKVEEMVRNYAANFGMTDSSVPMDKLLATLGIDEAMMEQNLRPSAEIQVRNELMIEAIIAAEAIEATEEEVDAYIAKIAESYNVPADNIKTYFGADYITNELKKEKATDLVINSAVITEEAFEPKFDKAEEKSEEKAEDKAE